MQAVNKSAPKKRRRLRSTIACRCRQTDHRTKREPSVAGKLREGSPEEEILKGGFFARHPFPDPSDSDHRSEARARLGWGNTEAREPRAWFSPGVPELSPILGSRPYGGVSGVPYSQRTNGSNTSVGGWGCRGSAHCHIPLCVGPAGLVRSRLNDLPRGCARSRSGYAPARLLVARSRPQKDLGLLYGVAAS